MPDSPFPSQRTSEFRLRTFSWANLGKYLRYCRIYGVPNATRLAFRKVLRGDQLIGSLEPMAVPGVTGNYAQHNTPVLKKTISIVIPTQNAGRYFGLLLRKLKAQKSIE